MRTAQSSSPCPGASHLIDAVATPLFPRAHQEPEQSSSGARALPIRSDTRAKLVTAIARGRQWLSEIEAGAATIDGIAAREACSKRHVNMTISLAFLAPRLVEAAVEGRLPHGIGAARLFEAPVAWSRQHQMLGLAH
jgi:site-specific DNA recombinase